MVSRGVREIGLKKIKFKDLFVFDVMGVISYIYYQIMGVKR